MPDAGVKSHIHGLAVALDRHAEPGVTFIGTFDMQLDRHAVVATVD